jgi:hypothetical protein
MDERAQRVGENEVLFRDVNERIAEINRAFELDDESFEVVCECGDASCTGRLTVTIADYARVRSDPRRFLILPGHDDPSVERVVAETEGFAVVQKREGGPAELAIEEA